jgi:hypothetical protein
VPVEGAASSIRLSKPPAFFGVGLRRAYGPVAQLGERLVCIQEVVGSNPVGSTSLQRWEAKGAYSSVWLERTPDKREVGGSNPPRPTSFVVFVLNRAALAVEFSSRAVRRDL